MSILVREMEQSTSSYLTSFSFPFHPPMPFKSRLFSIHKSWTETAKNKEEKKKQKTRMYAKHSDAFCTILGQTAICTYSKLMNTFFLFTNHFLRHCFSSFWVTVALFVLCPFVKLFLNVYTWFSDCLFCTFKFIIKQFKLSPWCLEDHIV